MTSPQKCAFVEVLFVLQCTDDADVHWRERSDHVIVQHRIWRVQSIDATGRLLHDLIGIVERIEYHRVRGDAVPAFASGRVLHQIDPLLAIGKRIMHMPIPLGNRESRFLAQSSKDLEFAIEVVEYNAALPLLADAHGLREPPWFGVDDLPKTHHQFRTVLDRFLREWVPSVLEDALEGVLVVPDGHQMRFPFGLLRSFHGDENMIADLDQSILTDPLVDLRILAPTGIYRVHLLELPFVLVEPIGDEHRHVIAPRVSRSRGQQYPSVALGDLEERLGPRTIADDALFVKYKERVLDIGVLLDVVPRIHGDGDATHERVLACSQSEFDEFVTPFTGITFAGRGDDIEIRTAVDRTIGVAVRVRAELMSAFLAQKIYKGGDGLAGSNTSTQNLS